MTEIDLFPRGRGGTNTSTDEKTGGKQQKPKGKAQDVEKARRDGDDGGKPRRKRKAPGAASPTANAASGGEKDWLFGSAPQRQSSATTKESGSRKRKGTTEDSHNTATGSRDHGSKKSAVISSEVGSGMLVSQTGRAPRLQMVSFNKLDKGTLVLGVIFKVEEHDMVVSLPSSLTGVVRKKEVSDYFYAKASSSGGGNNNKRGGKGRYFNEVAAGDISLREIFKEGQVVRCAILNLRKGENGRRIELSLRASVLNKGLSLSQLTAGCGVYGSVVSCEDHGYVMSLGLEGVTAFLPSKEAPKAGGLKAGQPVEAVIKTVKAAARTITLSAKPELVASAVTKGTAFDLRSLKPGMLVDTIVDSVLSNGMLVSFLGFFAGCVDHNNMPVVSGDDKEDPEGWRKLSKAGPEPVRARILMVDYANKAIRLTLRPHLLKMQGPSDLPPTGSILEGEVVRVDPLLGLLLKVPAADGGGAAAPVTNVPLLEETKKKEWGGKARRARARARAEAEAEAQAAAESGVSNALSDGASTPSVGAFAHVSRISDDYVDHPERLYKPGQKVRCRVTGSSLLEGWVAVSMRSSVLAASVLRYQDLHPGAMVEGEVSAVESFGLLVKLGEGVRALVQKNHLGDTAVKNPKSRFKEGTRVKGKVLSVDAASSRATITLKRSMLKDKRPPITTYEEAKEGVACTGFVTKIAPFGLHVAFYGGVYGTLHTKSLARHGIEDPAEAFTVGQVVGCVVRRLDVTGYPPRVSLGLDVAGGTDTTGAQEGEQKTVPCPLQPGHIASGTVSSKASRRPGHVLIDIKSESGDLIGFLPHAHLGDHASVCNETLAARLRPGTVLNRLLVVEIDRRGVPLLSIKPLLLRSATSDQHLFVTSESPDKKKVDGGKQEAFMPRGLSDLSPGDLVAGFVSRVETFGVFVRFLGGFTGLAPRALVDDKRVEDPTGMFGEGDSVWCMVKRVDMDSGRASLVLCRSNVPSSDGLYLRTLLSETFGAFMKDISDPEKKIPAEAGNGTPLYGHVQFGNTCSATVVAVKEYGIVLKGGRASKKKREGDLMYGQLMVCPLVHAPEGLEGGLEVKVRILGVDLEKSVVDVTMDRGLVKAGRAKAQDLLPSLNHGEKVSVKLVLAKPHAKYAIGASKEGRLFVIQVADYHCPHRTNVDAGFAAAPGGDPIDPEMEVECRVADNPSVEGQGHWGALDGDADGQECSPFARADMLVPDDDMQLVLGKRKGARSRKRSHEDLELGDSEEIKRRAFMANAMKDAKVALGNLVPGAEVACEVIGIHEDRLDVKVAVRYPKSYGRRSSKGQEQKEGLGEDEDAAAEREEDEGDDEDEDGVDEPNKKRRRDSEEEPSDGDFNAKSKSDDRDANRKKIVRIRAKVHLTAAGKPAVDAPSEAASSEASASGLAHDDAVALPKWHPLSKYYVGQVLMAKVLRSEDQPGKNDSNLVFRLLELGLSPEGAAKDDASENKPSPVTSPPWWGDREPKQGEVHRGVISEVMDSGVMVSLSMSVRGLLPWASMSDESGKDTASRSLFKKGMGMRVLVRNVDKEQHRLIFTLKDLPSQEELPDSALPAMSPHALAKSAEKKTRKKDKKKSENDAPATAQETSPSSAKVSSKASKSLPPAPGDVVRGEVLLSVKQWLAPSLMVSLDGGGIGRVCVTELADKSKWKNDPLSKFEQGQRVTCRVLHPAAYSEQQFREHFAHKPGNTIPVELSLRKSRLKEGVKPSKAIKQPSAPAVGSIVKCYVASVTKAGCFVRLNGGVRGRVMLKLLSDRYVPNPQAEFPPGRMVLGKVLEKDEELNQVSLTFQDSAVRKGDKNFLTWDSKKLKMGLKVKGVVTSIRDYGVFIQVQNSSLTGLCHISEAADKRVTELNEMYDVGDLVKAKVMQADKKRKQLSLGLKASYFEGDADSSSEDENEEHCSDSNDDEDDDSKAIPETKRQPSEKDGEESNSEEGKNKKNRKQKDDKAQARRETKKRRKEPLVVAPMEQSGSESEQEGGDDEDDSDDVDSEEEEPQQSNKKKRGILSSGLGEASAGTGGNAFSLDFGAGGSGAGANDTDDDDSSDDSDEEDEGGGKGHRSRKKAKERREEEERIVAREKALQDEDAAPETAGDFERLLIASPNESLLWVKFMAFKLGLADIDGARAVAERALKTISFREEQERYNVWVSLLNLEHKFGTRDSLKKTSDRACQNSKPKKVYLHLAEIHDKAQETEQCEEVYQAAAKKFRHSKKVWMAFQLSRLKRGDDVGAREILQRSLQSLSKHKHVPVISRFARNEFDHGSVERGRSIFEGLMASYPKRLDLWNVYLDKEIKKGEIRAARNLLERLTGMQFNPKRMKSVFKKYMQFEQEHGDEAGVENVKGKAMAYVASLAEDT